MNKEALEDLLYEKLLAAGLGGAFERQARFSNPDGRKWRFDFFFPFHKLAIEVEGGTFSGGRHSRGMGMREDMEKYNVAALAGIRVLRFDAHMIKSPPFHHHKPKTRKETRNRALEGCAIFVIRKALTTNGKKPRLGKS